MDAILKSFLVIIVLCLIVVNIKTLIAIPFEILRWARRNVLLAWLIAAILIMIIGFALN